MLNDVERAQRWVVFCSTRAVAIFEIDKGLSLGLYSLRISSVSSWEFVQPVFINGLIFVHGIFHLKKTNFQLYITVLSKMCLKDANLQRPQHWHSAKTSFSVPRTRNVASNLVFSFFKVFSWVKDEQYPEHFMAPCPNTKMQGDAGVDRKGRRRRSL